MSRDKIDNARNWDMVFCDGRGQDGKVDGRTRRKAHGNLGFLRFLRKDGFFDN